MAMISTHTAARQPGRHEPSTINVGEWERLASVVGGGTLAIVGLTRSSPWGWVLAALGGGLLYRGVTGHCPSYSMLGINTADKPHGPESVIPAGHGVRIERSVVINRSPEECFRFWRRLENLPRFMTHLATVRETSNTRSTWVAREPLGIRVQWDAEIINELAPQVIAWRSLPNSDVQTAGSVHFTSARFGRGTEVRVNMKYDFPGGSIGSALARLFGQHPDDQVREDLERFKQLIEAGEIATTAGQPVGR